MLLRAPPPRITMPPTPMRANFLPASGSVAGTLQKTSCAARRRLDQPASSDETGWLGDVVGPGDAVAVVAAALPPAASPAASAAGPEPQATAAGAARTAAAARTSTQIGGRRRMTPPRYHRPTAFATSADTMSPSPRGAALFGRNGKPRLVHLKSRLHAGAIVLTWDVRGGTARLWRVLRSAQGFANGAFDDTVVASGQTLISDKADPGARDDGPKRDDAGFYSVFAESERGDWRCEARLRLTADDPGLARRAEGEVETGKTPTLSWREKDAMEAVDFRLDTLKSRLQREHPSVRTDDVD